MPDSLINATAELDERKAVFLVKQALDQGRSPVEIVEECRKGMTLVGERYAKREYFLSDLIMSAEIFKQVMSLLLPALSEAGEICGIVPVVFGTVQGDIHDIGKDITISLLRCSGFEVEDLGVDVPPDKFVQAAREKGVRIICLSALLTASFESMKKTVELFEQEGLRQSVKVVIGGLVNEKVCKYVGADCWANDARHGVEICRELSLG